MVRLHEARLGERGHRHLSPALITIIQIIIIIIIEKYIIIIMIIIHIVVIVIRHNKRDFWCSVCWLVKLCVVVCLKFNV